MMRDAGSCSFIIKGVSIPFDEMRHTIGLSPTDTIVRGSSRSKRRGPCPVDIWVYEVKFGYDEIAPTDPNGAMKMLMMDLSSKSEVIKILAEKYEVFIRLYLQSDWAQIWFEFSPQILKELSDLGLRLEMSILSWGGVKDN